MDEKKPTEPQEISREEFMKRCAPSTARGKAKSARQQAGAKRARNEKGTSESSSPSRQRPKGASPFSTCARRARIPLQFEADGI